MMMMMMMMMPETPHRKQYQNRSQILRKTDQYS